MNLGDAESPRSARVRSPQELRCSRRIRVSAGNRVGQIPLQGDHLLPSCLSLLRVQLGLLNCHHGPYGLLILTLAKRSIRLSHGRFRVASKLRGIQYRTRRGLSRISCRCLRGGRDRRCCRLCSRRIGFF
jgi:hypothetical protein